MDENEWNRLETEEEALRAYRARMVSGWDETFKAVEEDQAVPMMILGDKPGKEGRQPYMLITDAFPDDWDPARLIMEILARLVLGQMDPLIIRKGEGEDCQGK